MKDRIEKILIDKKMTQAEFADFIEVNRSSVTHIMTGRNKTSDTVVARTLLAFPDINPQWLSEGTGEMYRPFVKPTVLGGQNYQIDENHRFERFEQENLFTKNSSYLPENKQENAETPFNIPRPELDIQSVSDTAPAISPFRQDERREDTASPPFVEKQIRKIVFFYADKTFEEYYPEGNIRSSASQNS